MLTSKDLAVIIIGTIISLVAAIAYQYLVNLNQIELIFSLIIILALMIFGSAAILYKRIRESEGKLDEQEQEQKKLEEKLKIHEQLIDIKANIKNLQIALSKR